MSEASHVVWPAERFYWAQLGAPGLTRPGELPLGLRGAFEEEVPAAGDDLHVVYAPVGDGRILACGARREDLLAEGALRLSPASVPGWAQGRAEDLNLLVGTLEPLAFRRSRRGRHLVAVALVTACIAAVCWGLLRRASHWQSRADHAVAAAREAVDAVMPGAGRAGLATELERARRAALTKAPVLKDASVALASLLRTWPLSTPSKPVSIGVFQESLALSVNVEGDSAQFLNAFKAPAGWKLAEPQLTSAGSLTRLSLVLRRENGGTR